MCAVISNGTSVQGLGKIGSEIVLPAIEGKCLIFNRFAGVEAIPLCLRDTSIEKVVKLIADMSAGFAAINLVNIKPPECFDIEKQLSDKLNIPVFHDDQDGTAIVVLAGLINSAKLLKKEISDLRVVINGSGAAGIAIANLLLEEKVGHLTVCDSRGPLHVGRNINMNKYKEDIAHKTNKDNIRGTIQDALKDADVFIGVSVPGCLKPEWIKLMKPNPIIFALSLPNPEIWPNEAKNAGAFIVATGRSDMKNHLDNSLVFPGLFRGLLEIRANKITTVMKLAAARAIASIVIDEELRPDKIIPDILDVNVPLAVARVIILMGRKEGVGTLPLDLNEAGSELYYHTIHGRYLERRFLKRSVKEEEKTINDEKSFQSQ